MPARAPARVVVLAGPSGSGKSRLAERMGLPVLRLDDFYKDGDDPTLPRIGRGPNAGLVDWDDSAAWLPDDAVAVLAALCRGGRAEVPVYDIARNGRVGAHTVDLAGAPLVVAEGIFAPDVVAPLRESGLLAVALCVRRRRLLTFALRLQRDLRERRKPPLVLLRRGRALMRAEPDVVAAAVARGCDPATPRQALARVASLRAVAPEAVER